MAFLGVAVVAVLGGCGAVESDQAEPETQVSQAAMVKSQQTIEATLRGLLEDSPGPATVPSRLSLDGRVLNMKANDASASVAPGVEPGVTVGWFESDDKDSYGYCLVVGEKDPEHYVVIYDQDTTQTRGGDGACPRLELPDA